MPTSPAIFLLLIVTFTITHSYAGSCFVKPYDVDNCLSQAKRGDAKAQYKLGEIYIKGLGVKKNLRQSLEWYNKSAEQGYAEAQFYLGKWYYRRKIYLAADWYRKAAKQGHMEAQFNLGGMYSSGRGEYRNYHSAAKWYQKAAKQGHVKSLFNLGVMYEKGLGTTKDITLAHMFMNLAAARGHQKAARARNRMAKQMTPYQIEDSQKMARKWFDTNR